jgi:hypothetical protein
MVSGLRTFFYADGSDQAKLMAAFVNVGQLRYTFGIWWNTDPEPSYLDPRTIPNLGVVRRNHDCPSVGYRITYQSDTLVPKVIENSTTGVRYEAGPNNPDSVRMSLGGDAGDQVLICSLIDTVGATTRARQLHTEFTKAVRRESSVKCGRFFVLPGAAHKLEVGWRLAEGVGRDRHGDFRLEQYKICIERKWGRSGRHRE